MLFAFRLAVELLPPFGNKVQFRVEIYEQFGLLSALIESSSGKGGYHGNKQARLLFGNRPNLSPPPPSFSVPPSRLSPPLFTFLDQSYQELSTEFIFSKHLLVAFRVLSIICLFSGSLISCLYYFFNFAFFDLSCCFFPDLRASRRCLRRAGGEATASQPARQAAALGAAPWR